MNYYNKKPLIIFLILFFSIINFFIAFKKAYGWIDIPLNTWVARTVPPVGQGPSGGMKHMRLTHNPVNGRIYFEGGDYTGPIGLEGGRNETYAYSIADNTWELEHPYCGPAGSVQPMHPDQVGWVYDTKRNIFWMTPGHMGADQGICQSSTLVKWKIMTFDPATRAWSDPGRTTTSINGEVTGFAQYDPLTDKIIRFYENAVQVYDIAQDIWTSKPYFTDANGISFAGVADWGRSYTAMDLEKRRIYFISPLESRLYRYDMDTQKIWYLNNTPIDTIATAGPGDRMFPIWDSINKVLLWPQIFDNSGKGMKFHVYHPDTNTWETSLPLNQPEGLEVRGNNVVFDPFQNVLLIMGGAGGQPANPYIFLYRYGNGSGAPDVSPPAPPTKLQIQ